MDEVDKIIVHSLNEIGCGLDDNFTMAEFTPNLLVHTVSKCLQKIQTPSTHIPHALPEGLAMAQRFSVATTLSSIIYNLNYRGDIGYQTFLYPNEVDVRKLLMFLVEKLPRDEVPMSSTDNVNLSGDLESWRKNVKEIISRQLHKPWIPQYCRNIASGRTHGCSSQITIFKAHHNLNISTEKLIQENANNYSQHKNISIFQQTGENFELISSVLHKNSFDLYADSRVSSENRQKLLREGKYQTVADSAFPKDSILLSKTDASPLSKLTEDVNNFKSRNVDILTKRKKLINNIIAVKNRQATIQKEAVDMRPEVKMLERTCLVLDNPKESITKLETLISNTLERRKKLDQQWEEYRQPMVNTLKVLRSSKQLQKTQNVKEYRQTIAQLHKTLQEKKVQHQELSVQIKMMGNDRAASRKEYIHRIFEFISNIRKQRSDIYKVLDDTRDLQKQLNFTSAQLQRQFCYTDDLLFQTAKQDTHSKQAYKLLATLHTTCSELVDLVTKTGYVTNNTREIEVQIDSEKAKNVTASLQQITADIGNFENIIHSLQTEIRVLENEISSA
ncbi:coiled-coil domain-containing protein 22 homolog [Eurosta solidaginis]|uniref:coiled-coil domain-containing protein 22 homolog n=1 Tax=Eurosta solidaginis TaxID=178769 RepID=UPI0035310DF7